MANTATHREILSQPATWASVLGDAARIEAAAEFVRRTGVTQAAVVGCGSSFYLAQVAAAAFNRNGLAALPLPASEGLFAWSEHVSGASTLLIALSRSGETTEVLWAVDEHRASGRGPVLAITCAGDSALASAADHTLALDEANEESFVMTRSFSSMLLSVMLLGQELSSGEVSMYSQLPELCRRVIESSEQLFSTESDAQSRDHIFVLGSGCAYGIANEGALKLIEVSLARAQAFHHLEVRHGPKSVVDAETLVVSLATPEVAAHEAPLVDELESYGAIVLRVGGGPSGLHIPVAQAPDAAAEALVRLPALQLLAHAKALAGGIAPDQPRHLDAVVRLASDTNGSSRSSRS